MRELIKIEDIYRRIKQLKVCLNECPFEKEIENDILFMYEEIVHNKRCEIFKECEKLQTSMIILIFNLSGIPSGSGFRCHKLPSHYNDKMPSISQREDETFHMIDIMESFLNLWALIETIRVEVN